MTQKPSAPMSNAGFVHLHVHSAYSLLRGSIKIQKLGELAKARENYKAAIGVMEDGPFSGAAKQRLVDGYADNNPDGPDPDYDPDPDPNMLLYGQVPHFDDFMADPVPFAFCMDT